MKLDAIKIILFDFDDTLAIHKKHTELSASEEFKHTLIEKDRKFINCDKSYHMQQLMNMCNAKGISIGLMSAVSCSMHANLKLLWVQRNYGMVLKDFCVSKIENKIDMLIAISEAYDIKPCEIAIVDDYYATLTRAADAGFQVYSPMEVVNFVEAKQKTMV